MRYSPMGTRTSSHVYPLQERRNFDFCRWWIAMKTTFSAAATATRIFCPPELVFASSDSPWSFCLSFSTPAGSTLSGRHSMFVIEPGWAWTESLRLVQPVGRPPALYSFCFYSSPVFICTTPYAMDYRTTVIRFACAFYIDLQLCMISSLVY